MKQEKFFYGWRIVAGGFLITCTLFPPLIALYNKFLISVTADLGVSRSAFTLAHTITQVLGIFISPFIARLLSRYNFRAIMSGGVILFGVSYASYSLAQNIYHFYAISFLVGIGFLTTTMIPLSMLITNWFVKQRGLAISIVLSGIGMGGFVLSPLLTYFLTHFGWRASYQLMGTIMIVVALPICLFVVRKKPEDMGLKAYGVDEAPAANAAGKKRVQPAAVTMSVKASMATSFFWLLIIGSALNGLVNIGALGQFPPALEEKFGPHFQANIIAIYSLFGLFGKLAMGWICDRWGVVAMSVIGCAAFGVAFPFMLFAESHSAMYLMAVVFGFGFGIAIGSVPLPLITAAIYGPEKYGEAYGLVNSALQIGLTFGSIMVAGIFDLTGSYNIAWALLFVLTVATMLTRIGSYVPSRKYTIPATEAEPAVASA